MFINLYTQLSLVGIVGFLAQAAVLPIDNVHSPQTLTTTHTIMARYEEPLLTHAITPSGAYRQQHPHPKRHGGHHHTITPIATTSIGHRHDKRHGGHPHTAIPIATTLVGHPHQHHRRAPHIHFPDSDAGDMQADYHGDTHGDAEHPDKHSEDDGAPEEADNTADNLKVSDRRDAETNLEARHNGEDHGDDEEDDPATDTPDQSCDSAECPKAPQAPWPPANGSFTEGASSQPDNAPNLYERDRKADAQRKMDEAKLHGISGGITGLNAPSARLTARHGDEHGDSKNTDVHEPKCDGLKEGRPSFLKQDAISTIDGSICDKAVKGVSFRENVPFGNTILTIAMNGNIRVTPETCRLGLRSIVDWCMDKKPGNEGGGWVGVGDGETKTTFELRVSFAMKPKN